MLLPPTWVQLHNLSAFDDVASALAAEPDISPVEPEIIEHRGGLRVGFDGSDEYWADYQRGHAAPES